MTSTITVLFSKGRKCSHRRFDGVLDMDKFRHAIVFAGDGQSDQGILAEMEGVTLTSIAAHGFILTGYEPCGSAFHRQEWWVTRCVAS